MTLSPDGRYYWDGQAWRPALSPDGRYRWAGTGWVPVFQATVLRPTAWTVPLQRSAAALIVVELIWGVVVLLLVMSALGKLDPQLLVPPSAAATMTPAEQESLRQTMQTTITVSAVAGLALGGVWNVVILAGCLKRWRWIFWYQMIVGLFAALGLLEIPALITGTLSNVPTLTTALLPAWAYAISFVLDSAAVGLSVWMIVALRRYGTWACVREPAA